MSCDNLQGNGELTRRVFTAFARLRDPELGDWVEREVRFPNSMVDRITPVTTDADRAEVRERFGIDDRWPVVCEPYTQWVLEDSFTAGRPPYEQVGVQVVDQVEPYELMKLRLLNGSHQAMCYFAYLCRLPAGARGRPGPAVPGLPARLHGRGGHPDAGPGARGGPDRVQAHAHRALLQPAGPRHHRPAVRAELGPDPEVAAAGGPPAARCRRRDQAVGRGGGELGALRGGRRRAGRADRGGRPARATASLSSPGAARGPGRVHRQPDVFGDLADDQRFVTAYRSALASLHQRGARATLESLVRA